MPWTCRDVTKRDLYNDNSKVRCASLDRGESIYRDIPRFGVTAFSLLFWKCNAFNGKLIGIRDAETKRIRLTVRLQNKHSAAPASPASRCRSLLLLPSACGTLHPIYSHSPEGSAPSCNFDLEGAISPPQNMRPRYASYKRHARWKFSAGVACRMRRNMPDKWKGSLPRIDLPVIALRYHRFSFDIAPFRSLLVVIAVRTPLRQRYLRDSASP